jgi:hypothetical protein
MKNQWFALRIAVVCVAVWIVQNAFPSITDDFGLVSSRIFEAPWTLLTYMFLHADFEHLFYNMFALLLFGLMLEGVIGSRNFLKVYFLSGMFAGIGSLLFYEASIGASGAVYGIIGALAVLRPMMFVISFGVPLPMVVAAFVWVAGDIMGFFLPSGNIAYMAHIFGITAGAAYGFSLRKRHREPYAVRFRPVIREREFRRWEDRWL